jgi:uncharacterized protein
MACTYCYAGKKRKQSMTLATAAKAIDFAAKQDNSDFQLGFFGGEPLLEWDLLQKCVKIAEEKLADRNLVPTITTNGIGLTEERTDWLYSHNFYIGLSIDGNRAMHDTTRRLRSGASSHAAVVQGLHNALQCPEKVETITVLDPANISYTAESINFLAELGVKRISLNPNFYTEWNPQQLEEFKNAYEAAADCLIKSYRSGNPLKINVIDSKIITALKEGYACSDRCKFGCGEIAIAPSGRIYPCERLVGDDDDDAICIGDIQNGFDKIKYPEILAKRGNRDPECETCELKPRCMNWCGCINYTTTGAIDSSPGILCFHEKISIAAADRAAATLFKEHNPDFLKRFYQT